MLIITGVFEEKTMLRLQDKNQQLQNLSISLGNIKILKISWSNQKSGGPRMLIITDVFEEKTMLRLQDKNQALQECL